MGYLQLHPRPLCDNRLFLTFNRGALVAKRSEGL